jgi:hypothetical protein
VAQQQVCERGLAAARGAAEPDAAAGRNLQVHIAQHRLRAAVAEAHAFQADQRRAVRRWKQAGVLHVGLCVCQVAHAIETHAHTVEAHVNAKQGLHRSHRHAQVGSKSDQRAERHASVHHFPSARHEYTGARNGAQPGWHGSGSELGELQAQQPGQIRRVQSPEALALA